MLHQATVNSVRSGEGDMNSVTPGEGDMNSVTADEGDMNSLVKLFVRQTFFSLSTICKCAHRI